MFKSFISISMIFVVSGCTVVMPHVSEYRINPVIKSSILEKSQCSDKTLKLQEAFSSNSLMIEDMNYAVGKYESDVFTQSKWAETPNRAITSEILKMIRESKYFKSVQNSKSRSKSDLILETNIEDFMQYFSDKEESSLSKVVITNTLINTKTSRVLKSKTFSKSIESKTIDAKGGVVALNKALSEVLTMQRDWLKEVCK